MRKRIVLSLGISLIVTLLGWGLGLFFELNDPTKMHKLVVSMLTFIVSFLISMQLSIFGLADVIPVYEAMHGNESMRALVREFADYKATVHTKQLLVDPVIDNTISELTRLLAEAKKGRIEIRTDDFVANIYREVFKIPDIKQYKATNMMPDAWNARWGAIIMEGNAGILKNGGTVSRIFLLGGDQWSVKEDSKLLAGEQAIRNRLSESVGPQLMTNYFSKCVSSTEIEYKNYFILDDRLAVVTQLDSRRKPVGLVIIEEANEIRKMQDNFQDLNIIQALTEEEKASISSRSAN